MKLNLNEIDLCKMPYVGIVINPQGNLSYCCMGVREIYNISHIEEVEDLNDFFINSTKLNEVREMFKSGLYDKIVPCSECYIKEKQGIKTFRNIINEKHQETIDVVGIQYLELTSSNICNATCSTCNSKLSSSWKKFDHIFGREPHPIMQLSDSSIAKIIKILPKLKWMMLKGGEPFADKNNFHILEELFKCNPECKVNFVSNLSILKDYQINILKKKSTNLDIYVSIDAIGDLYNWIRSTDFNIVDANMKRLYEECGLKSKITITLSAYNLFNLHELVQYFDSKIYVNEIDFSNILHKPQQCSIGALPKEIVEIQIKKLLSFNWSFKLTSSSLEFLKSFSAYAENVDDLLSHIHKMNSIRKTNLFHLVPELDKLNKMI